MSIARYFSPALRPWLIKGIEPDWLKRHKRRRYIVAAVLSAPAWVNRDALKRLHAYAQFLTLCTGVEYVIDHIIPLNHPDVCGLTVPWNLRVVTRAQNAAKSNYWNPWQTEFVFETTVTDELSPMSLQCDPWKRKLNSSNAAA